MIPNEINGENSRNNFVQIRLGEIEEQKEPVFKESLKKEQKSSDLCEQNRVALEKYHQYLNLNYRKKTTIQK